MTIFLRRYSVDRCPSGRQHHARVEVTLDDGEEHVPPDDPRWPATCEACGYRFGAGDYWHNQVKI